MTFTGTANTSTASVSLSLSMTSSSGLANIVRQDPNGSVNAVRNAAPATLVGGAWVGIDYEAPLGQSVTYTATDVTTNAALSVTVTTPTISNGSCWLKSPNKPGLNLMISQYNLQQPGDESRSSNSVALLSLGQALPVAWIQIRSSVSGVLSFVTRDAATRAQVDAMLDDGTPLLLQFPASLPFAPNRYISIGDSSEARVNPDDYVDQWRVWTLPFDVTDAPIGFAAAGLGDTWAVAKSSYTTWAKLKNAKSTWGALALYPGPTGV